MLTGATTGIGQATALAGRPGHDERRPETPNPERRPIR